MDGVRIVHLADAPRGGASEHRGGGVEFTYLLEGEEGRVDNFALMQVHVAERYGTPRHRHNFEQVRVMLDGSFGFGPGKRQDAGSIGYFCEGTYYTQEGEGPSTTLLLQVAGPSGQGYMSNRQLRAGVQALKARGGSFADGVYTWHDAAGTKHNLDGYEAVWQQAMGRPVRYAAPRFDAPVLMAPERFEWLPVAGLHGVDHKALASFHERGLALDAWRIRAGAAVELRAPAAQRRLGYVRRGRASAAGQTLLAGSAFDSSPGAALRLSAFDDVELLTFTLPRFD